MSETTIGPRTKEALSWMVISEVLRKSSLDLDIAVLHPGDGQYDTLSLVAYEGNSVVQINRNGTNALAGDELVEGIFSTAAKSPSKAADRILDCISITSEPGLSASKRARIESAVKIANFLSFYINSHGHCEWGWNDSTYGVGPSPCVHDFVIPESWKQQKGRFIETGWQSGIFLLYLKDVPKAAVNLVSREMVNPEGKKISSLVKGYEYDELTRAHSALRMFFKNREGKVVFDDEVHPSMTRMTRKIYSEEYLSLAEEKAVFEFSCDEDEALTIWGTTEGVIRAKDYLD
jgi:hypothetical protein